jgi:hypothetical protein
VYTTTECGGRFTHHLGDLFWSISLSEGPNRQISTMNVVIVGEEVADNMA